MSIYEPGEPENKKFSVEPVQEEEEEEKMSLPMQILDFFLPVIIALGVAVILLTFVVVNARIPSGSMEDTIMTGDRIIGYRLAYINSDPERYDIIVFKYPDDESQLFIKRVIGLPGETVIVSEGQVYVYPADIDTTAYEDAELLEDPEMLDGCIVTDQSFLKEEMLRYDMDGVFRVPEESYFVLGDNRNNSRDSRFWTNTYVAKKKIVGKAILRYWPITEIKLLGYDGDAQ